MIWSRACVATFWRYLLGAMAKDCIGFGLSDLVASSVGLFGKYCHCSNFVFQALDFHYGLISFYQDSFLFDLLLRLLGRCRLLISFLSGAWSPLPGFDTVAHWFSWHLTPGCAKRCFALGVWKPCLGFGSHAFYCCSSPKRPHSNRFSELYLKITTNS